MILLVVATFANPVVSMGASPRFLGPRAQETSKQKSELQVRKDEGPGYWRSDGVRGGVEAESLGALGDSGAMVDSSLDRNWVTGAGMALDFGKLDNLNPIAPMDRMHTALGRDSEGAGTPGGHFLNPVYVPKYLNPDAFPSVVGKGCNCSMPSPPDNIIQCSCGKNSADAHYTWLKATPVPGTNNYTLTPADLTYRGGSYWGPETRDGIIAPADALPTDRYPNQALGDHIWPLPVSAQEDRIPVRFARYLDQVHDRTEECDTTSKKCTVLCKPGDQVVATIGNVQHNANIIKAFVGNAVQIEFYPSSGHETETVECPMQAACTAFRYCKADDGAVCTSQLKDEDSFNWQGRLVKKHKCPKGTKVCKTVNQVVMATGLKKGDKTCKAGVR